MIILANGNVGIGTTTVGDKLVVQGAASATASIVVQDPTANDYGAHFSFDDANNRVIIGGLTNGAKNVVLNIPRDTKHLGVGTNPQDGVLQIAGTGSNTRFVMEAAGTSSSTDKLYMSYHTNGGTEIAQIAVEEGATNQGQIKFLTGGTNFAMIIDKDGNVGIGTTGPATSYGKVLHIHDTGTSGANLRLTDATSGAGTGNGLDIIQLGVDSYFINREAGDVNFFTNGQSRITIHADGHLGFGDSVLNDSAWSTVFGARSQWDTMGTIAATDGSMQIGHNWYYDAGGSTGYKYIASGKANRQIHVNDYISWEMTNSTGSAGGEITFVEVMKLTANGNLGIGNVLPAHPLHIYEGGGYYASIGRGNSTPGGTDPWLGLYDNADIASSTFGWGIYDSSADGSLQIWNKNNNATGTNTFTIKRGGNIGIGTNNPSHILHSVSYTHQTMPTKA